jgi:hypothetical protein
MNPGKIEACLGDIFYDYKTHFSAYKIEDLITIKSGNLSSIELNTWSPIIFVIL